MSMKIKFINAKNLDRNLKASVHKTGKIGFTAEAADKMRLSTEKFLVFGINEEDELDKNLYVIVNETKNEEGFPILLAGGYFYANVKPLLKELKIDYDKTDFYYEITKEEINGDEIFVFKHKKKTRLINKKEVLE